MCLNEHCEASGIKATQTVVVIYKNDGVYRRYSEGFKLKIFEPEVHQMTNRMFLWDPE